MGQVPAARRALAVLRLLASAAGPMPASAVARELGIPRSSAYHLLNEMAAEGFVTHLPEERLWGLGVAAFEIGSAYLRQGPLERLARLPLRRLVDRTGEIAQLGVLHGAETLYLLKEQPPRHHTLVTDVGVRMPAHLTASGRSMLARLPAAQVRALFSGPLVTRTGRGPTTLRELRRVLAEDARRGWSVEDGLITEGFASIAACVVDHTAHPAAAVTLTFRRADRPEETWPDLAARVQATAAEITRRLGGRNARP
ncbi:MULTISPECIES: IclR family transcriptional regulator [Thermomonospora]|uniref:Transcriptional regulator, IclR family n=1 Tax=Thermomonospora curvata (strain ATCC 19995 / DSM 43183 / JCM 3096 / KCTC 9072 / NBRC 15933 / NCIMB 10081 / Henssen B9) TaxID=471852 RepID=D1ABY2_THECD|nr:MULTISPECIES: IclR family transcriptional regulator [Thermomonospora]ACY99155.1 transcriptional regulator, IclR family [Thermomonospora curvata DSM 43183]PKK13333.1 MAG: IclR family transcriptional regulator [Thermomonospora sp. CIF 1]